MNRFTPQMVRYALITVWVLLNTYLLHYNRVDYISLPQELKFLFYLNQLFEFVITPFSAFFSSYFEDYKFIPNSINLLFARLLGVPVSIMFYRTLANWIFPKYWQ